MTYVIACMNCDQVHELATFDEKAELLLSPLPLFEPVVHVIEKMSRHAKSTGHKFEFFRVDAETKERIPMADGSVKVELEYKP